MSDSPSPGPHVPAGPTMAVGTQITTRQLRWLIAGLMVGLFLSSTEQSVVATALPSMAGELGGTNRIAWVVSAYLLTSTVVTPLYGKLSDLYGRRIVYQASIAIFVGGSLLCGIAQTMNQLVAARAIQGAGGGGLMSLAFIILGDVVSPRERGRYIGVFTGVFAFSAISGPLWGGLLVDTVGWRWIFFLVVPIGLAALVVTNVGLRLPFVTRRRPIDWLGSVLLVGGATALILVPIWGGTTFPWGSVQLAMVALTGVVLTALFLWQETRAEEPVLPLRLFRDRTVSAVFGMGFGLMFAVIAVSTFMPFFLQVSRGVSATSSGLMLVPQTLGITIMATLSGRLVSHSGRYKWTLVTGPIIAFAGLFLLSTIDAGTSFYELAPYLMLMGVGMGFIFPNLTLAVQNAAAVEDLGVATSTANFFRNMGAAFGAAVVGAALNARLHDALAERLPADELAELGGAEGLIRSPEVVRNLPADLHAIVIDAVQVSVTSVYRWVAPVALILLVLALLVHETPLRTTSSIGGATTPSPASPAIAPAEGDVA